MTDQTETDQTATHQTSASRVLARAHGALGHLTLDRPEAINALDLGMVLDLARALDAWAVDSDVEIIVLDGAGDRGLCAGGDVRGLYRQIASGDVAATATFFRAEYALNAQIDEYPKPLVALADGITMGGGIGLAGHAAIRVVTERSKLAMPETRIGFTPDVGGTWLLGRAPGRLGEYLGLTGASMDAADAIHCGFADYFVPAAHLDGLREALQTRADPSSPTEIVLLFDETAGSSSLEAARPWIDDAFSAGTVAEIIARLRARAEPEAIATADLLATSSPTALTITLEAVRRARALPDLRAALEQEYRLVMWFGQTQPDLLEGIRAQLVDKDRNPRWRPATLDDLAPDLVAAAFSFEPPQPLWS
ncbi:enoyl-CoA hydratase/isomerase family protein [Microbacterium rhizomatis]|uniref:3-hydroxyisobutyryl-CoA hydrolase n=1 Tax=Microbacterium rhizomatis TaxID=1631477 RepID=A0A5J5J1M7_9MICO|nr:enoyl-CoA hydratase/isomerase family protein [Microbacterium rhizomatis]KAA9108267.1 enoyl-CoA hydratase/isomerase family protein [Microbacterium rhizomatis]